MLTMWASPSITTFFDPLIPILESLARCLDLRHVAIPDDQKRTNLDLAEPWGGGRLRGLLQDGVLQPAMGVLAGHLPKPAR